MITARVQLDDYTSKVLNVVKAKFGLRDKSAAINKFVEMYGDDLVEKQANDQYVKKVIEISEKHIQKYGKRKMTLAQLDTLCEE